MGDAADNTLGNPGDPDAALAVGVRLGAAAQLYVECIFGTFQGPRIAQSQPLVRGLHLPSVADLLVEDSIFVANAVADGGNVEGGEGIHEAGGQAAQSAVAEAGLFFLLDEDVEIDAQLAHGLLGFVVDAEVDQVVGQMGAGEELGREVTDDADILGPVVLDGGDPALDEAVADGVGQSHVEVVDRGALGGPALDKEQVIEKRLGERLGAEVGSLAFLRSKMRELYGWSVGHCPSFPVETGSFLLDKMLPR